MSAVRELAAALLLACPLLALAVLVSSRSPTVALQVGALAAVLVVILVCFLPSTPAGAPARAPARLLVIVQISRGPR